MITAAIADVVSQSASAADLEAVLARQARDIPSDGLRELAELLERYLHDLPNAIDALTSMTKEPRVGRSVAFAAGQVLLYVVDDDDLFSETEMGAVAAALFAGNSQPSTAPPPPRTALRVGAALSALGREYG